MKRFWRWGGCFMMLVAMGLGFAGCSGGVSVSMKLDEYDAYRKKGFKSESISLFYQYAGPEYEQWCAVAGAQLAQVVSLLPDEKLTIRVVPPPQSVGTARTADSLPGVALVVNDQADEQLIDAVRTLEKRVSAIDEADGVLDLSAFHQGQKRKNMAASLQFLAQMRDFADSAQGPARGKYEYFYLRCLQSVFQSHGIWLDESERSALLSKLFVPQTQDMGGVFAYILLGEQSNYTFKVQQIILSESIARGWIDADFADAFGYRYRGASDEDVWTMLEMLDELAPGDRVETLNLLVDALPVRPILLATVYYAAHAQPAERAQFDRKLVGGRKCYTSDMVAQEMGRSLAFARYVATTLSAYQPEQFHQIVYEYNRKLMGNNMKTDTLPATQRALAHEGPLLDGTCMFSLNNTGTSPKNSTWAEQVNEESMVKVLSAANLQLTMSAYARYLICFDYAYLPTNVSYGYTNDVRRIPGYFLSGVLSVYDRLSGQKLGEMAVEINELPEHVSTQYMSKGAYCPFISVGSDDYEALTKSCIQFIERTAMPA